MFEIIKSGTKIDFVGKRHIWVGFSLLLILITFVLFFVKGLNYGIDFTGGAEIQLKVEAGFDSAQLRASLDRGNIQDPRIVAVASSPADTSGWNNFMVRVQGDEKTLSVISDRITQALQVSPGEGKFDVVSSGVVGPAAGSTLRKNGFLAMFYALLAILIYVALRFDSRYAPGAVLALFHDTVIVIGVFILTQKQFDLTILASLLALIGYSNNDTIIVFDRVRETTQLNPRMSVENVVNQSINETLGRTLLTSFMTFLVAFSLWAFGGHVIQNFAFTFMIGILVGTYSSIFIASSLVIFLTHWEERKKKKLV